MESRGDPERKGMRFPPEEIWGGQLIRFTVSMTGKKWLNGSVAQELSRGGDSVVGVTSRDLPFSRKTTR